MPNDQGKLEKLPDFGSIITFGVEPHAAEIGVGFDSGLYIIHCQCNARWVHSKNVTVDEVNSIYESHLSYFKHKPIEVL